MASLAASNAPRTKLIPADEYRDNVMQDRSRTGYYVVDYPTVRREKTYFDPYTGRYQRVVRVHPTDDVYDKAYEKEKLRNVTYDSFRDNYTGKLVHHYRYTVDRPLTVSLSGFRNKSRIWLLAARPNRLA